MSAAFARIREAVGGFLRGFLGTGAAPHLHGGHSCTQAGHGPTPSSMRHALAVRSTRRGNCC